MDSPSRPAGTLRVLTLSLVVVGTCASALTSLNAASSLRELASAAPAVRDLTPGDGPSREALAEWRQRERQLAIFLLATELPYAAAAGALAVLALLLLWRGLAVDRWIARAALFTVAVRLALAVATYRAVDEMLAFRDRFRSGLTLTLPPQELERLERDIHELRGDTLATTFAWAAVVCGYYALVAFAFRRSASARSFPGA